MPTRAFAAIFRSTSNCSVCPVFTPSESEYLRPNFFIIDLIIVIFRWFVLVFFSEIISNAPGWRLQVAVAAEGRHHPKQSEQLTTPFTVLPSFHEMSRFSMFYVELKRLISVFSESSATSTTPWTGWWSAITDLGKQQAEKIDGESRKSNWNSLLFYYLNNQLIECCSLSVPRRDTLGWLLYVIICGIWTFEASISDKIQLNTSWNETW